MVDETPVRVEFGLTENGSTIMRPGEILSAFVDILDLKSFSVRQDGIYSIFSIEWLSGGVAELRYNRIDCLWHDSSYVRDIAFQISPGGVMTYHKINREQVN